MRSILCAVGVAGAVAVSAQAGVITLNADPSLVVSSTSGINVRYRVSNTNWDHLIATSSNVTPSTIVSTANLGTHTQLNNALFNFTLAYSPATGVSFRLQHVSGGAPSVTDRTLTFTGTHSDGSRADASFNALYLYAQAGDGMPSGVSSASVEVSNLVFSAPGQTVVGALANLTDVWTPGSPSGLVDQYVIAEGVDLATLEWTLSGQVRASYALFDGATGPGGTIDERLKFNLKFRQVELVPAPGAIALLGLVGVAALRRRR
jgi:hypothetical protein